MADIRPLTEQPQFEQFAAIIANAYPTWGFADLEPRQRLVQRMMRAENEDPTVHHHGLYHDGTLAGGFRMHDFTVNVHGTMTMSGGLGLVAVELLHRRQKAARNMVLHFVRHYRERGAPLTLLYPFRPDFYGDMGYGFGTRVDEYRILPSALLAGPTNARVRYLTADDRDALVGCYHRVVARTHGMAEKTPVFTWSLFDRPENRVVGYDEDGDIRGYIIFLFKQVSPENFVANDMHIQEFIAETPEAFRALVGFLHSAADQVSRIVWPTQEESFIHALRDPRDGSGRIVPPVAHQAGAAATGLMYRISDVRRMFEILRERDFGGQTCRLKVTVEDDFVPENQGSTVLHFQQGSVHFPHNGTHDVEIRLEVAKFSSLFMGAAGFKSLYQYGLAEISDVDYLDVVHRIFACEHRPICTTAF